MRQDYPKGVETNFPGVWETGPGTYRVRETWTDERTGKQKEVHKLRLEAENAAAAALELQRLVSEKKAGVLPAPTERQTVTACAKSWLALSVNAIEPGTVRDRTSIMESVLDKIGDIFTDRLMTDDLQRMVNGWDGKLSPSTIRHRYATLCTLIHERRRSFSVELRQDLDLVKLPAVPRRENYAPEPAQVLALLDRARNPYPLAWRPVFAMLYPLLILKLRTGQRFTHVAALRREDIDRPRLRIHFARKVYRGEVRPTTAVKSVPEWVEISTGTLDVLDEYHEAMMRAQHPGLATGWMFPGAGDKPLDVNRVYEVWGPLCASVGIDAERWTQHKTRGMAYDLLRLEGVDPVTARALVGHSGERMRAGYSTVREEERRRAVAVLERGTKEGA